MTTHRLEVDLQLELESFELRVSLATNAGSVGVFGPSGSGKTSLLESLAGLRPAARGRIALDGRAWLDSARGQRLAPEKRGVGYVPQDGRLFPHLDVRGNLASGRFGESRTSAGLEEVARLLGLEKLLERRVDELSGGERQRVALGRALCSRPRLLLLDEPLAALDVALRRRLLPYLQQVRQRIDVPSVLVTHDPLEAQVLCEELYVLREGRVVAQGAPREVLTDPEVFPLAARAGFENVLRCRVREAEGRRRLFLGNDQADQELVVAREIRGTSCEQLVGVPAHEIIVATESPRGLSARNVLPARVLEIFASGDSALVSAELEADGSTMVVEVTERTPGQMGLAPGWPGLPRGEGEQLSTARRRRRHRARSTAPRPLLIGLLFRPRCARLRAC